MSELKPCPFCGGEAHVRELRTCDFILYSMSCETPRCYGFESQVWFSTHDAAAEAWNRRAERTCRNESDPPTGFLCSACGWGDFCEPSHLLTTACFAGGGILNYCPNCGARVEL